MVLPCCRLFINWKKSPRWVKNHRFLYVLINVLFIKWRNPLSLPILKFNSSFHTNFWHLLSISVFLICRAFINQNIYESLMLYEAYTIFVKKFFTFFFVMGCLYLMSNLIIFRTSCAWNFPHILCYWSVFRSTSYENVKVKFSF